MLAPSIPGGCAGRRIRSRHAAHSRGMLRLMGVHLQQVLRPVRIVLHRRQRLHQSPTTPVDEQTGRNSCLSVPQPLDNSARPLTPSIFAGRSVMPSRAYSAAMVVPSLCWLKTSVPATNRWSWHGSGPCRPNIALTAAACRCDNYSPPTPYFLLVTSSFRPYILSYSN
jgi:hypothetical protein